jgi:hypothetical protein
LQDIVDIPTIAGTPVASTKPILRIKGRTMHYHPMSNGPAKKALTEAMTLAEKMLKIANRGYLKCKDDSCMLVYGVIRDCGYQIRRTVEREQSACCQKGDRCETLH